MSQIVLRNIEEEDPEFRANLRLIKSSIGKITELSPYDSWVTVEIIKKRQRFLASIRINHAGGSIQCSGISSALHRAISRMSTSAVAQIAHWRARRQLVLTELVKYEKPSVLVVEDDETSLTRVRQCLNQFGMKFDCAMSAGEAIQKLKNSNFKLVILDWHLPLMNGDEIVRRADLEKKEGLFAMGELQTPVVTFSGWAKSDIRFPHTQTFRHWGHWDKNLSNQDLKFLIENEVNRIKVAA